MGHTVYLPAHSIARVQSYITSSMSITVYHGWETMGLWELYNFYLHPYTRTTTPLLCGQCARLLLIKNNKKEMLIYLSTLLEISGSVKFPDIEK